VNLAHFADDAVVYEFHRGAIDRVRLDLISHLRDDALLFRDFAHTAGFEHCVRQRLLTENMLAKLHRRNGDGRVHVVGRGDDHGVERVRLVKQPPKVGKLLGPGKLFDRPAKMRGGVIDIAQRGDFHARAGGDVQEVVLSLAAGAD
jgi:hypothetical protein